MLGCPGLTGIFQRRATHGQAHRAQIVVRCVWVRQWTETPVLDPPARCHEVGRAVSRTGRVAVNSGRGCSSVYYTGLTCCKREPRESRIGNRIGRSLAGYHGVGLESLPVRQIGAATGIGQYCCC